MPTGEYSSRYQFSLLKKMDFKTQELKKSYHKIPHNPPFSKGETIFSSLWQREVRRDFQIAKCYFSRDFTLEKKNGRLRTLESIRGGREEEKSLKRACDSVKL
jgi:hypothetical protein